MTKPKQLIAANAKKRRGRPRKILESDQTELKKLRLKLKEARRQLRIYKKQFLLVQQLDDLLAKLLEETVPHWCFEYPWYNQLHENMKALGFEGAIRVGFLPELDPEVPKNSVCMAPGCQHPYFEHVSRHGRVRGRIGCLQCSCGAFRGNKS